MSNFEEMACQRRKFLEELAIKRRKFLEGLDANEGEINLDIFEDFYPDKAHFVFELLQNAEDAEATEAIFILTKENCTFEHNGKRHFTEKDVGSITGINNSTKSKSPDQIGKFGVGFKSVFVYTLTPHVYSDQFAFRILRLVLPEPLDDDPKLGDRTRFVLPFNNPKKPMQAAYEEIKVGLEELAETNLLFLSSLESIRWQIDQQPVGEVLRIKHPEHHIEVQKLVGGKTTSSSNFLRFTDHVENLDKQYVAMAFELEFLSNISSFDTKKLLNEQLKIIPADPGRVAVFFPADKETSGLRFHLHAPFVPELSRASIKDTPVNKPLFEQLAKLAASSLHTVCDLKLLTSDFLEVLPNHRDTLPKRYQPIRDAIIMEMNDKPLTPTYAKKHEPARHLLQAKKSLKELLSEEDIEFLVDYDEEPFKWAIAAQQKNSNVDHFLNNLAIKEWDVEAFVKMLEEKASYAPRWLNGVKHNGPDVEFIKWLTSKPEEWHQELYSLLSEYLNGSDYHQRQAIERLKPLKIVRLSNGAYSIGSKCYFPSDDTEHDELLPRVANGVFLSGKSEVQQKAAKTLLSAVGVRNVGEGEQVEAILKQRYSDESCCLEDPNINDLKRFISLVEKEPEQAKLFANYYIFKRKDGKWSMPKEVFLDDPFVATGLSAFYDALGEKSNRIALAESYKDCGINYDKLAKFAEAVGAKVRLDIEVVYCWENPDKLRLCSAPGQRSRRGIDKDYTIKGLKDIIDKQDKALSYIVWRTLCNDATDWFTARYRSNANSEMRSAPSQLICILQDAKWVPQKDHPFVSPNEASRELLPEGFPFDAGQRWLKEVHFGEAVPQVEQRKKEAVEKGLFRDEKSLEDGMWFAGLTEEERQQFREKHQSFRLEDLYDPEPGKQRSRKVGELDIDTPKRLIEQRTRSVSVGREPVKKETEPYLLQQYKNGDDPMICQVCKKPMPFKLDDGSDYFEMAEFLPLKKLHYQNFLALCPNHWAMFRFANGSHDKLKDMFLKIEGNELKVVLAQKETSIYFKKIHIADLKAVIKAEQQENEQEGQS